MQSILHERPTWPLSRSRGVLGTGRVAAEATVRLSSLCVGIYLRPTRSCPLVEGEINLHNALAIHAEPNTAYRVGVIRVVGDSLGGYFVNIGRTVEWEKDIHHRRDLT